MVRWAHSLAVAISAGRTSTGGSIGRTAARCAGTTARRSASITGALAWATIARTAVGPLASRPGGTLAILAIPLATHDDFAAPNHLPVHAFYYAGRVRRRDFYERMTFAQVDLSNVIAWNSAFSSDRAHQIANLHAIAGSNRHEKARHSSCRTSATRFTI
jgi:hypothetical protein